MTTEQLNEAKKLEFEIKQVNNFISNVKNTMSRKIVRCRADSDYNSDFVIPDELKSTFECLLLDKSNKKLQDLQNQFEQI